MSLRRQLSFYLLRINHLQLLAERIRSSIASNPYYQSRTVFQRLDKFGKGYIVVDDLAEAMLQNAIYPTQVELFVIFRSWDINRGGLIGVQGIQSELLPRQDNKMKQQALARKYYPPQPRLPLDLQFLLAKYFTHQLKSFKELQQLCVQMAAIDKLFVQKCFGMLDSSKTGILTVADIDKFMRSDGKTMSKPQLERIHRVLNFNRGEGIPVTYQDLQEHMSPLGKGFYLAYSEQIREKQTTELKYIQSRVKEKYQEREREASRIRKMAEF